MLTMLAFDISKSRCTTSCCTWSRARWKSQCRRYFLVSWYSGSVSVHVCPMFSFSSKSQTAHIATVSLSVVACHAVLSCRVVLASVSYVDSGEGLRKENPVFCHFSLQEGVSTT